MPVIIAGYSHFDFAVAKSKRKLFISILLLFLYSCETMIPFKYKTVPLHPKTEYDSPAPYPGTAFTVISDVHLCMFPNLAVNNNFDKFSKLLEDSEEILLETERIILTDRAEFIVVPGDLTEFGEYSNHAEVSLFFDRLEKSGKQVFVVPGNHDILNYNARLSPSGASERPITPTEFRDIYSAFGYGEALDRDPDSLSYVAEPRPGLWLLALDSCRYDEQNEKNPSITGGRLKRSTLAWIETVLLRSVEENKAVMAFMHHNLLEHFSTQKKYFKNYVVENNGQIAEMLAHYNVRLVFTGHYHAQDITLALTGDGKFLFDVETGSLVSYPCPLRSIRTDPDSRKVFISTTRIASTRSHPADFQAYAKERLRQTLVENSESVLQRYGMSTGGAKSLSEEAATGYISHTEGNEDAAASTWDPSGAGCFYGCAADLFIGDLATSIWKDLPPPDNNLVIDMNTGEWNSLPYN